MEEIYYVDRTSIPATQQNIIHLGAIIEHSIFIGAEDINDSYGANVVEVRNSEGEIDGTLLYFQGVTYAQLTSSPVSEEDMLDELEVETDLPEVFDGEEVGVNELAQTPQTVDEFNAESMLIDLELELAEATHTVQEIEDQIAAIKKESFVD